MTLMILVLIAGALFTILWLVFTIRDFMGHRG